MVERPDIAWCESLVRDVEGLSPAGWARLRSQKHFQQWMWEYFIAKCLTDFHTFVWYGIYWKARGHYNAPLFGREGMAGFLQDWTVATEHGHRDPVHMKVMAVAREHCKTQMGSVAWSTWQWTRDPNWRALIRAYKAPKAWEITKAILAILDSNDYKRKFPWVCPETKRNGQPIEWRADAFRLQRDDTGVRVPSCEAIGLEGDPTGGHFNARIYDDYEVKTTANSDVERPKMQEQFREDSNLVVAGGRCLLIGTPWGRDALMLPAIERRNDFGALDYDLFVQPCVIKAFDHEYHGKAEDGLCVSDDRVTVKCPGAGFHASDGGLRLCGVDLKFYNQGIADYTTERREIVDHGADYFVVNRPLPSLLGQPHEYHITGWKPAAPNRMTLDSHDQAPEAGNPIAIDRASLPRKKLEQGSLVYSMQMELNPVDEENLILNPDHVKHVTWDEIPEDGEKRWYRCVDFATGKKTRASTAMCTGFWMEHGLYIWHIFHKNECKAMEKLYEMFVGEMRVREAGFALKYTTFEEAHEETNIGELMPDAQKDPYEYFKRSDDPKLRTGARTHFTIDGKEQSRGSMHLSVRNLGGRGKGKQLRIEQLQPFLERGEVYFIDDRCGHWETLEEHMKDFRRDSQHKLDLLETIADLALECERPQRPKPQGAKKAMEQQRRRMRLRGAMLGGTVAQGIRVA